MLQTRKKKVPISKIPMNLVPFPNVKAVTSKTISGQCGLRVWWETCKNAHLEAGLQEDGGSLAKNDCAGKDHQGQLTELQSVVSNQSSATKNTRL
jgi:hypothetical protein